MPDFFHSMLNPELVQKYFFLLQILIGALFLGITWVFLRPSRDASGFRESDGSEKKRVQEPKLRTLRPNPDPFAQAKMRRQEPPKLTGIRIDGEPHEILGIRKNAAEAEIQSAFRELIKRYHPDKVGRPGSREWTDAQKIAEALNRAKTEMLRSIKPKK